MTVVRADPFQRIVGIHFQPLGWLFSTGPVYPGESTWEAAEFIGYLDGVSGPAEDPLGNIQTPPTGGSVVGAPIKVNPGGEGEWELFPVGIYNSNYVPVGNAEDLPDGVILASYFLIGFNDPMGEAESYLADKRLRDPFQVWLFSDADVLSDGIVKWFRWQAGTFAFPPNTSPWITYFVEDAA